MYFKIMGLHRTDGQPEFGESDYIPASETDKILGENEADPETKPCPFCGSKYTQVRWIGSFIKGTKYACGFSPGFMGRMH